MKIHLVKHSRNGLGYAVKYENKGLWKVRFFDKMHLPITFTLQAFKNGYLEDFGVIDNTEKNHLFS